MDQRADFIQDQNQRERDPQLHAPTNQLIREKEEDDKIYVLAPVRVEIIGGK